MWLECGDNNNELKNGSKLNCCGKNASSDCSFWRYTSYVRGAVTQPLIVHCAQNAQETARLRQHPNLQIKRYEQLF